MLDETHIDMLRTDAALETAWQEIERLRRELDTALDQLHAAERDLNGLSAELRAALADAMQAWKRARADRAALHALLIKHDAAQALIEGMRRTKNS